jgi:predicted transcriptional regulator/transcriptional regulator with XRE-family HTH domain
MPERKMFAGARLKRLRRRLGLGQSQMAAELGVSPSYLNLMERDQRPLTVQVLLKLSSVYAVDVAELAGGESTQIVDTLKEIFSDPLIAGEIASPAELVEMAESAPNAVRAIARLHAAWREALERLSDFSQRMASGGEARPDAGASQPQNSAPAYFEATSPWFPELETAAEEFAEKLLPRDDPSQALKTHLRGAFGVDTRILPGHVMPIDQARYDRHSQRLFLSERVPLIERPLLMARQVALLGARDLLDRLTREAAAAKPEAARIIRAAFARRLAEAMLAPAGRLSEAARDLNLDVARLADRFVLKPSHIMARLAALGAGGRGVPAAFMVFLDASGGVLSRLPGAGFPFPHFGPFCARLPIFDGLPPGLPLRTALVTTGGDAFLVSAVAEEGIALPGLPPPRRLAMIGWRREEAAALIGDHSTLPARPIGLTCRLCERLDCGHRMHPPMTRPAAFHEHVVGPSDYELAG